jgi:uncharacterized protein YegL
MHQRKAPIYLLIDTSGSMNGEAITSVKNGMDICIKALRTDPVSMEKAYVSIITFADEAKMAMPLTYVPEIVNLPDIEAKGVTSMGDALRVLNESLEKDLVENTETEKGDYKAFVVIFTDGRATDKDVIERELKNLNRRKINYLIAATTSEQEDVKKTLTTITEKEENVIYLPTANADTFKKFFIWLSQSASASITRGGTPDNGEDFGDNSTGGLGELPPLPRFDDDGDLL